MPAGPPRPAPLGKAEESEHLGDELEALSLRSTRSLKSWANALRQGARFERWLLERGLNLDEVRALAPLDGHGFPAFPAVLVIAHLWDIRQSVSQQSLKRYRDRLLLWIRGTGWSLAEFGSRRQPTALGRALGAMVAGHRHSETMARVRRPARAVGHEEVAAVSRVIDRYRDVDGVPALWVECHRTFNILSSAAAFRATEAVVHSRWSWFRDHGSHLTVGTPGEHLLKMQEREHTLILPTLCPPDADECRDPDICVIHQLRRHRARLEAAGLPTGPADPLFPAPRPPDSPLTRQWWPPGCEYVADPVGDAVRAAVPWAADPDELALVRQRAVALHYARYSRPWARFAAEAGIRPRHDFERVSTQGLRRGKATDMARNGAPMSLIQAALRHESSSVTASYIDDAQLDAVDPRGLFDLGLPEHPPGAAGSDAWVEELLVAPPSGDLLGDRPSELACAVAPEAGDPCGAPSAGYVQLRVGGAVLPACDAHCTRWRRGSTGADLRRPIRRRVFLRGMTCGIRHDGRACDRPAKAQVDIGDGSVAVCKLHYDRWWRGVRGDRLTRPAPVATPELPA